MTRRTVLFGRTLQATLDVERAVFSLFRVSSKIAIELPFWTDKMERGLFTPFPMLLNTREKSGGSLIHALRTEGIVLMTAVTVRPGKQKKTCHAAGGEIIPNGNNTQPTCFATTDARNSYPPHSPCFRNATASARNCALRAS